MNKIKEIIKKEEDFKETEVDFRTQEVREIEKEDLMMEIRESITREIMKIM